MLLPNSRDRCQRRYPFLQTALTDVDTTIGVAVVVAVIAAVVAPPWCKSSGRAVVARIWECGHAGTPCGDTALESSRTINHVDVTVAANAESIVAVVSVEDFWK